MAESPSRLIPTNPESGGWGLGRIAHPAAGAPAAGVAPGSEDVAGREAVTYVRGAVTAKVQGHNWVPIPSTDHMVSAGSPAAGSRPGEGGRPCAGGQVRRRPAPVAGGGGPVVVRGRESRSHGEGAQPVFAATESTGEEIRL